MSKACVDKCFEVGINFFDTAEVSNTIVIQMFYDNFTIASEVPLSGERSGGWVVRRCCVSYIAAASS